MVDQIVEIRNQERRNKSCHADAVKALPNEIGHQDTTDKADNIDHMKVISQVQTGTLLDCVSQHIGRKDKLLAFCL